MDGAGAIRYVSSVCRPRTGVRERIGEHVREWWKELHWTHIWVVPLAEETPPETVKYVGILFGPRRIAGVPDDAWPLESRVAA